MEEWREASRREGKPARRQVGEHGVREGVECWREGGREEGGREGGRKITAGQGSAGRDEKEVGRHAGRGEHGVKE